MIVITLIKTLIGWFVLIFLGTNLIGLVVRGFFRNKNLENMKTDPNTPEFLKNELNINNKSEDVVTLICSVLLLAYFWCLFHFWNGGVALAGIMLVVSRIPDLLLEIKTGDKNSWKNEPKGLSYIITTILTFASLVVLWVSL